MTSGGTVARIGLSLIIAASITLPWVLTGYQFFQVTQILIYAIAVLGLNILTGYNGQISLGQGAFYAIGAYVASIIVAHVGLPYWAGVPIAAVVCFIVGFVFGLPALKLEGPYLALATFGLALTIPHLIKHPLFEGWTGGVQGLFITKPDAPSGFAVDADQWIYYFVLIHTIVVFWAVSNLLHGRIGRAIVAIRDNQLAAESMGVNASLIKALVFGVSALCTGLAGGLSAVAVQFVAPDSFTFFLSIFLLVGGVVGGVASIPGAFFGAAFIVLLPNVASSISQSAPGLIYGLLLILMVYLMPKGAWGTLGVGWAKLNEKQGVISRVHPHRLSKNECR